MNINVEDIKALRAQTSAGLADVKAALEHANGNYDEALKFLHEKGLASASKRVDRQTSQGVVYSYVHNNRIGVMLELNCETDFVARNQDFIDLAKELAIQIVLNNAIYVDSTEVAEDKVKELKDEILMMQPFYKDSSKTVEEYIKIAISKFGENIKLRRFYKMTLAE